MKKIFVLIFVTLVTLTTYAQNDKIKERLIEPLNIKITETNIKYKKETVAAQTVYIHAEEKAVEKKFKDYFSKKYSIEFEKDKGMLVANTIKMPDVTAESINLIANFKEDEEGTKLDIIVDLGVGFISNKTNPTETANLVTVIRNFVNDLYVGQYEMVIALERKDFEKNEKEHEKMIKEGEKLQKEMTSKVDDISDAERDITKSEQAIVDLQSKIESLKADIIEYKEDIEDLKKEIETNKSKSADQKVVVESKRMGLEKLKSNADALKTDH